MEHAAGRPAPVDERLALLREVLSGTASAAAEPPVLHCLDAGFRFVPTPESLRITGLPEATEQLAVGEIRSLVSDRDNRALLGAIGQARTTGVGSCLIRRPEDGAAVTLCIIDLTDAYGVYACVSGPSLTGDLPSHSEETSRPRRILTHRNEIAEFTWVDPRIHELLGLDGAAMIGRSALDFIHPDDHDRGITGWLKLLSGETPDRHRVRFTTGDGGWRWIEITHTDRLDEVGHIETEMLDVDDEMRALAEARAGELRFYTLTESLPLGVAMLDASGRWEYGNRWIRDFFDIGLGPDGRASSTGVRDPDRERVDAALAAALESGAESDLDLALRSRDGESRLCRMRVRPVRDDTDDETDPGPGGAIVLVEDVTDSVVAAERLRERALTDALTGLANRAALVEYLDERVDRANEAGIAVLFVDLDGFKMINDGLGHEAGDVLLTEVAARLRRVLRPGDRIGRVGGDEFVVICPGCASFDDAVAIAERLLEECERPVEIETTSARVSCSVGIAYTRPGEAIDPNQLLTNADLAMYKAKRSGGARWDEYDESLRSDMAHSFELQRGILDSLRDEEFTLFLQPLRDLTSGRTIGAECLVRWYHPKHGLTGTDQFIPIAERSGLIVPLGRWILDSACRIAARARAIGREDLRISVNVSGRQLGHSGFVDDFLEAIDRYGIPASQLILEVTETVFIGTDGDAVDMLRSLKRTGATIALDDFGTGYSSLNQLRFMPASMLKIDGSYVGDLVDDPGTRAITTAIVELSRELDFELIAEGVETSAQLRTLQTMGVQLGQGYLLGRPAPEEQFFTALRERRLAQLTDIVDLDEIDDRD